MSDHTPSETAFNRLSKRFVNDFLDLYPTSPLEAKACLVGATLTILAALEPEERATIKMALGYLMLKLENIRFEDGVDFVDFLKEITEQDFGK